MAETDKAYVAIEKCGCVTAALVAGCGTKREEIADLKRWMKDGRRIEITTVGEARQMQNFLACPHDEGFVEPDAIADEATRLVTEARA